MSEFTAEGEQVLHFEDFELGQTARSARRTITDADLVLFAGLTGDHNPQHTDDIYAATTIFKKRIAHGALIFSIASGLSTRIRPPNPALIAFFGVEAMRFQRPVFVGDTIQATKEVIETDSKDVKRGIVRFRTTVKNQNDQVVLTYEDLLLLKKA
jgi:3-hydroxybutyryl-CoA dehydratase